MNEGLQTRLSKTLNVSVDQQTFVSKHAAQPLKRLAELLKHSTEL